MNIKSVQHELKTVLLDFIMGDLHPLSPSSQWKMLFDMIEA